jgi:hypothetical protein
MRRIGAGLIVTALAVAGCGAPAASHRPGAPATAAAPAVGDGGPGRPASGTAGGRSWSNRMSVSLIRVTLLSLLYRRP